MFIKTKEYLEYKKLTAMKSMNMMHAKICSLELGVLDENCVDVAREIEAHKNQLVDFRKYIASVEKEIAEFSK